MENFIKPKNPKKTAEEKDKARRAAIVRDTVDDEVDDKDASYFAPDELGFKKEEIKRKTTLYQKMIGDDSEDDMPIVKKHVA